MAHFGVGRSSRLSWSSSLHPDASGPAGHYGRMNEVAMYTPRQVADALMISRSSVYDLIGQGIIPSVKIGRCRRIPREPFRRYVDGLIGDDS